MVDYGMDFSRKREFEAAHETEGMPAMKRLKSPKSTPARGVSFSEDTKAFDGLSPASRLVDSVVWDFFMSQTVNSAEDIVQLFAHITDSCGCLHEVCALLDDLRLRLDESGCALVLPGGECPRLRRSRSAPLLARARPWLPVFPPSSANGFAHLFFLRKRLCADDRPSCD